MSMAIDQGVVTPKTTMNDAGVVSVGGAVIHNWNGAANGIGDDRDPDPLVERRHDVGKRTAGPTSTST
jgi:hypothetical protein